MMATAPGLRRALHLRHLIFMGLIIIQPTAPMPLFGVVSNKAGGHVVSTILVAMVGAVLLARRDVPAGPGRAAAGQTGER